MGRLVPLLSEMRSAAPRHILRDIEIHGAQVSWLSFPGWASGTGCRTARSGLSTMPTMFTTIQLEHYRRAGYKGRASRPQSSARWRITAASQVQVSKLWRGGRVSLELHL